MAKLSGRECLGIEFGSTRIKAVLIDENFNPVEAGSFSWENRFENGIWTYHTDEIITGLQSAYADLIKNLGEPIETLSAIGISAMMHGYLPFDKNRELLVPFRTWRNTITAEAAEKLTKLFSFNIPQRWSIAHLYQAILNGEEHLQSLSFFTTLAGFVHMLLTGENVLGVGDASGVFPVDSETNNYDEKMLNAFSSLKEVEKYGWNIKSILPKIVSAGEKAGFLTEEGAKLLDLSGNLKSGIPFCAPEGDAGTGMVATNSVSPRTGNVSAGTSIFSMVVLERAMQSVHEEIDVVATPAGKPVAMVHCNNCCTDLDCWVNVFDEFLKATNGSLDKSELYSLLYNKALEGDADCGGIVNFNYLSGEPVSHTADGRPLLLRSQGASFTLANLIRAQLFSTMATLKLGMNILEEEGIKIDKFYGHGGLFKTPVVAQKLMAGAMNTPVSVMKTAGEGGAWGIAVLAKYAADNGEIPLDEYLESKVFGSCESSTVEPDIKDVEGFKNYMKLYEKALSAEIAAYESI